MALFDVFTGGNAAGTANKQFRAIQNSQKSGFNDLSQYVNQGTDQGVGALNTGLGYLDTGTSQAANAYGNAIPAWQNISDTGAQGVNRYGQLAGLSGDPAAVQAALQATPGYQFTLNQGLQGLDRTANERGMLRSGNNTQDILGYASGLADQTYEKRLSDLLPYFNYSTAGAGGLSNAYNNLGNLYQNTGQDKAKIQALISSLYSDRGNTLGQAAQNRDVNIGNASSQRFGDIYNANQAASGNTWGAILNLLSGGAKLAGDLYKPTPPKAK